MGLTLILFLPSRSLSEGKGDELKHVLQELKTKDSECHKKIIFLATHFYFT